MHTPPTDSLCLALWQTPLPAPGDGAQPGLRALDAALAQAAALGAHWLVTPEMALTGYAIGADRARALAQAADGPLAEAVARLTQRHGVGVVYGFAEHNGDARPFNSVQAIDARGERLGLYRKTHLYGAIDAAQFSPGDAPPPVIDLDGWRIGLLSQAVMPRSGPSPSSICTGSGWKVISPGFTSGMTAQGSCIAAVGVP